MPAGRALYGFLLVEPSLLVFTGGGVNPAGQFGPAVMSGETHFLWVYLLAPVVGAVIGAWLRQTIQHRRAVLSHRLCGTQPDGRRLSDVSAPKRPRYLIQPTGGQYEPRRR